MLERFGLGQFLGGSEGISLRSVGRGFQTAGGELAGPLGIWHFPVLNAIQSRRR